jgi:6-phosphogluconolactonase
MSVSELVRAVGPEELARRAAADWLAEARAARERPRPYCVALSGGRIAANFLSAAAAEAGRRSERLTHVQFFWGDERCVPPTHPESNFRLAYEHLLAPLAIAEDQIHRVRGEATPESAAQEAEAELRAATTSQGPCQPELDLVLLGMGEDGHVASLFPGEPASVMAEPAVFRAVIAPKPPPRRITLGYGAIAAARQVWVLVSGQGKQGALRQSLAPAGQTPLARVIQARRETRIYTDLLHET